MKTRSTARMPRYNTDLTPTFMLTGEKLSSAEPERQAYARMLTASPQFARATVNMFWAQLMGKGIVDPPFGFDMARQDPAKPPPAPWTVQPSHPELLNALADDFRKSRYDLRHLFKLIVSSTAYQLSSNIEGRRDSRSEDDFAVHAVRRLSAEKLSDAISQTAGVFDQYKSANVNRTYKYVMQSSFYHDYSGKYKDTFGLLQCFGQTDREDMPSDRSSLIQAASLLNSDPVLKRVKIQKGSRLEKLFAAKKTDAEIVQELFLASINRFPNAAEEAMALKLFTSNREQGAEGSALGAYQSGRFHF